MSHPYGSLSQFLPKRGRRGGRGSGTPAARRCRSISIQNRSVSERTKRPWIVRWSVAGKQHSRSFRTKAEGERFRSLLTHAKTVGEPFDELVGEPLSWQPSPDDVPVHVWARRWLIEEWPEWAPRTRTSALEAHSPLRPTTGCPGPPLPSRSGMRSHLYPPCPQLRSSPLTANSSAGWSVGPSRWAS